MANLPGGTLTRRLLEMLCEVVLVGEPDGRSDLGGWFAGQEPGTGEFDPPSVEVGVRREPEGPAVRSRQRGGGSAVHAARTAKLFDVADLDACARHLEQVRKPVTSVVGHVFRRYPSAPRGGGCSGDLLWRTRSSHPEP